MNRTHHPSHLTLEIRGLSGARHLSIGADAPLLEALLAAGVPAPNRCREARCGRCRATVAVGAAHLAPAQARERARLGSGVERGQRLLCQVRTATDGQDGHVTIEY